MASGSNASAFNPAISLILAGSYANLSRNPDTYKLQGFVPTGGEVGPGVRGFSIGESELGISASIDPMFSGQLTASFAADMREQRGGIHAVAAARRRVTVAIANFSAELDEQIRRRQPFQLHTVLP